MNGWVEKVVSLRAFSRAASAEAFKGSLPIALVTTNRVVEKNRHFLTILEARSPRSRRAQGCGPCGGSRGEPCLGSASFWWLPVLRGSPQLVDAPLRSLPAFTDIFPVHPLMCLSPNLPLVQTLLVVN